MGCLIAYSDLYQVSYRYSVSPINSFPIYFQTFRSAILEGEGYIELPSPVFRRKAALGLSFRTDKPDGLLLFREPSNMSDNEVDDDDGDDKHYLALVMVSGKFVTTTGSPIPFKNSKR